MAKFKVEVLRMLLKNNKTAKKGELVDEQLLTDKDSLLKRNYISKATAQDLKADKSEEDKSKEAEEKAKLEANKKEGDK